MKTLHYKALVGCQTIEAEIAVLGGLMLDNGTQERIRYYSSKRLYNQQHRKIYSCILELVSENMPFDVVTINEKTNIENDQSFSSYLSEIIK